MSKYIITSDRVGVIGAEFQPEEGTNIEALISGGFIQSAEPKSAKTNTEPNEEK